ncbi:MAG: hypothetical protein MHPSP_002137, partial [Paramarteilia canceri]
MDRNYWSSKHPLLFIEALMTALNLTLKLRLLLLQILPLTGAVRASRQQMAVAKACEDILRLLAVFLWVLLAFSSALTTLFSHYPVENENLSTKTEYNFSMGNKV